MRTSMRRLALAAGAVITLAGAGVAVAQVAPPPQHAMDHRGRHGDPEAHAKRLRDVLQLRSDQDGALKAYLDATAPQKMTDGSKWERKQADDKTPLTTPERLDRKAAHMAKMAEAFQKRAVATKAFYAALSPSQRTAFDALGHRAGGPQMRMRRIDTRHEGRSKGGRHEGRGAIIKRDAG